MALLVAEGIEKGWGGRRVLRGCDLLVDVGDRVGLVGANGSGKSTLVRIVTGLDTPDHGTVHRSGRVGLLDQEPELHGDTVGDAINAAVAWHRALLADYQAALAAGDLVAAGRLQDRLDTEGWQIDHKIDGVLDQLRAPSRAAGLATLSGGERRRVALARALLGQPDLLVLDEPTNHLDADTVEWLQSYLVGYRGAVLLVTHDRYLLEAVADRIVEIEEGLTISYDGSYGDYLVSRAERQLSLHRAEGRRLDLIAKEAAWAARSPSARRTKAKARLERLEVLKAQAPPPRERDLTLAFASAERLGGTVVELHGVHKRYGDRRLIAGLDLALRPGDRLAVIGPNGAGKTTLLRLLLGHETPDKGEVIRGKRTKIGVLDQHRTGLREDDTVMETVSMGRSHVMVGERPVSVESFLDHLLFPRATWTQRVAGLSGGERARLLLAKLLLQGSNLLLLDEPTNDLDLLTLGVLEDALLAFDGCAIVVTHDRAFVDRVCTGVLAFEGHGVIVRYADRMQHLAALERKAAPPPPAVAAPKPAAPKATRKGLSFKEVKEHEELPGRIEALETEQAELARILGDPATYRDRADELPALTARSEALPAAIEALYDRWTELESRA